MFVSCTYVFAFKPIHWLTIPLLVLHLLLRIPCQVGFVNGNPSGSRSETRSKKPVWKSGSSPAVNLLTDRTLRCPCAPQHRSQWFTSLWHPGFPNNSILYFGSPRSLKIRLVFGSELRHHCLRCGHGLNATSFIHVNSVPFLSVWNCRFPMMKSWAVTKNLTPQEQIYLLRGSRWASTKSWCSIWLIFRKLQQNFAGVRNETCYNFSQEQF